jgi:O-methyltransferase involved in polyketide biosynthesis
MGAQTALANPFTSSPSALPLDGQTDVSSPFHDETKTSHQPIQPSVARMYDFYLGGTMNYSVDREAVAEVAKAMPDCFDLCLENRSFLRRAVRFMSSQGITQFIDIGSGLPTKSNTHEVAQAVNPSAKVVYVDMDPVVLQEGKALLASNEKTTTIICADVRNPGTVLNNPGLLSLIDFSKPVGVLMMCVACFWTDKEISHIMTTIRSTLASGSYIAATHDTFDGKRDELGAVERVKEVYKETPIPIYFRSRSEVAELFVGLELVEPGLVMLDEWHIDMDDDLHVATKWLYGGIGKLTSGKQNSWMAVGCILPLKRWMRGLKSSIARLFR